MRQILDNHNVIERTERVWCCPDCNYETTVIDGTEHPCGSHWGYGSKSSIGPVGARGPLMTDSGETVLRQDVASITPDTGLNTYQGLVTDILWPWKGEWEDGCTVTVYFDSATACRLRESLSGSRGKLVMGDVECSLTIVIKEPRSTSPSTSRRSHSDGI